MLVVRMSFFSQKSTTRREKFFFIFFTSSTKEKYVSHVLPERGREARVHAQGETLLTARFRSKFSLSLSLVYSLLFSLFHKQNFAGSNYVLTHFSSLFSLSAAPPQKIEFRKPLRMGSRRFPRTRRDSPRTISFRSRESRVRKGLVYSPRSSRRNNFKPNAAFSKKPSTSKFYRNNQQNERNPTYYYYRRRM
jgi:hypothetical protein